MGKILDQIRKGRKYSEWKPILKAIPNIKAKSELKVYQCSECRFLESSEQVSLIQEIEGKERVVATTRHYCEKCGKQMKVVSPPVCPHCASPLEVESVMLWD